MFILTSNQHKDKCHKWLIGFFIVLILASACAEEKDSVGEIKLILPGRTVQPPENLVLRVNVVDNDGLKSIRLILIRSGFHISTAAVDKTFEVNGSTVFNAEETIPLPIEFRADLYSIKIIAEDIKDNEYSDESEIWVKELITISVNSPKAQETIDPPYELVVDYVVTANAPLILSSVRFNQKIGTLYQGVFGKNYLVPAQSETFSLEIKDRFPFDFNVAESDEAVLIITGEVFQYSFEKEIPVLIRK